MNKELEKIIDFYEEEKQRLENLIQFAVKEAEYKLAHYHQKALKEVNNKLRCFKNLDDPNFDRIAALNAVRKIYDDMVAQNEKGEVSDYILFQKLQIDQQLAAISQEPVPLSIDGQEFDDMIFAMAENRISKFRFFLNKDNENFYLDFEKTANHIAISVPRYKKLKKNYTLLKSSIKALKNLGFEKTEDKKSLSLQFDLTGFRDAIAIKTLTSRILYDAIGYAHLSKDTIMQVIA